MIVRGFVLLLLYIQLASAATTKSRENHEFTISECAAKGGECDENRGRPVCGTDDQTYPTRCHLLRVQCSGHQVSQKYRGPCKACKEAHDYALKHKSRTPPKFIPRCRPDGTYAPIQCLSDTGCWCSDLTGTPIENTSVRTGKPKCRGNGKTSRRSPPRPLSQQRGGRRACSDKDRAFFNSNLIKVFQSEYIRSGQHQRDITAGLAAAASVGGNSGAGIFVPPADSLVLDWKFAHLDANANQLLEKNEFRELKKLVKRAVKPRRCGRAFGKFCDVDDDDRLSRLEWNNCISKDGINRHPAAGDHKFNAVNSAPHQLQPHLPHNGYSIQQQQPPQQQQQQHPVSGKLNRNNNNKYHQNLNQQQLPSSNSNSNNHHNTIFSKQPQQHHDPNNHNNNNNNRQHTALHNLAQVETSSSSSQQHLDYDDEGDEYVDPGADVDDDDAEDDEDDGADESTLRIIKTLGSSTNYPYIFNLRPKPDTPLKESEGESDCFADKTAALEEQRHGGTIFYVPECTADGRYQRVQCYRSTPYCWCVHEDTGKNIPGTSVKDKRPQCDSVYAAVVRPMKGCPEPRKTAFLKELKEFLKSHLLSQTISGVNTTKWSSEDERIATLSFVILDKNKNKAWERKEWKTFRELVTDSKTLRKCGKKMPRFCDVNSDKKITLSEWLNCLQAQRIEVATPPLNPTATNESASPAKSSKFTGSNPLEQYLKD